MAGTQVVALGFQFAQDFVGLRGVERQTELQRAVRQLERLDFLAQRGDLGLVPA
jgi:hypothetical protein